MQQYKMQLLAVLANVPFMGSGLTIRDRAPEGLAEQFAELATQELADRLESLSEEERRETIEKKIEQNKTYADEVIIIIGCHGFHHAQ